MPQHAYTIANQGGASFRADINAVLAAIVSLNAGATAPAPTFAYMTWPDATSGWLKQRNAANSAWIELWRLSDMALKDTTFALINGADGTKKLVIQLSGITAGQTRTMTVPDANFTAAGINIEQTFSAVQTPKNGALVDAATIDWDCGSSGNGQVVEVTLTAARTFGAPTNVKPNAQYLLIINTGGFTPAWNAAYKWPTGGAPSGLANGKFTIPFIGGAGNTLIPLASGYMSGA